MTSTTFDAGADRQNLAVASDWRERSDARLESATQEDKSPPRSQWNVARSPFWWALLATILLSAAGGLAIYFIHSTTPPTGPGLQATGRDVSKAKVAGAVGRPQNATAAAAATGQSEDTAGTARSAQSASPALVPGAAQRPGPDLNQPQAMQRGADRPGPTQNTTAAAPPAQPGATHPSRAAADATLQWSRGPGPATSTTAAVGTSGRPAPEGAGVFPPTVLNSAKGNNPAGAQSIDAPGAGTTAGSRVNMAAATQAAPVQATSVRPAAAAGLRDAQEKQCAESTFLSRLVCDERVRLRYCRDRWNEHPDCMVTAQQREP